MLTSADDEVESIQLNQGDSDVAELHNHVEDKQIVTVTLANHTAAIGSGLTGARHRTVTVLPTVAYNITGSR